MEQKGAVTMKQIQSKPRPRKCKQSINILGVDDDEICRFMLSDVLTTITKNSLVVSSGRQAIEEVTKGKVDYKIVIADLNMPEVDGYEVCKAVKAFAKVMKKKIIVLAHTASTQQLIMSKCNDVGFDYVLIKPVDTDKLKEVVNGYI